MEKTNTNTNTEPLVLGLDIGSNSIGWALVKNTSKEIFKSGVRIFETSVEGDIERGKEEPKNLARRNARQARHMTDHRVMRLKNLFKILSNKGLLPETKNLDSQTRHNIITEIDKTYFDYLKTKTDFDSKSAFIIPYKMRAEALDNKLEPHYLGRIFYHIAKHRGFQSNRKSDKKSKDTGKVKEGITMLAGKILETNSRTLGEFYSKTDPLIERIRGHWTSRDMYRHEFNEIWKIQQQHYPEIFSDKLKEDIEQAVFSQRPIKVKKNAVGYCQFEHKDHRADMATLEAQEFRILQTVNNLALFNEAGEKQEISDSWRETIIEIFNSSKEVEFKKIRKKLKISDSLIFNYEKNGEEKLKGNTTLCALNKVFNDIKTRFDETTVRSIVNSLINEEDENKLRDQAINTWKIKDEEIENFLSINLEDGYSALSLKALRKLLPELRDKTSYSTAVKKIYGEQQVDKFQELPSLTTPTLPPDIRTIKNQIVLRALNELRKVVNAVIREYGKPEKIVIEFARDMKKSKKDRESIYKENMLQEKERKRIAVKILEEVGIEKPSRSDIEKYLLMEESKFMCPYTGKTISPSNLFVNPEFEVEHIIPFSRSLDNSFANKTLCHTSENKTKGNRTPAEAYTGEKYEQIIQRVKLNFKGKLARHKLERFLSTEKEFLTSFSNRQLNDTRYVAKVSAKYLGLLYGGIIDDKGNRKIFASRGDATAFMRLAWNLNSLLGKENKKERTDHRHHALDAITACYVDGDIFSILSQAAEGRVDKRKLFACAKPPYWKFFDDCMNSINSINVSHRVSRKVNSKLHDDTFYSEPKEFKGKKTVHIRKSLSEQFDKKTAEKIVDDKIRNIVLNHLENFGGDPKKAFAETNMPAMESKDGRVIPIRKVRIRVNENVFKIGNNERARNVLLGSNHHIEIFETTNKKGEKIWDGKVVTTLEAAERVKNKLPIINRNHGEGTSFLFSLASGESLYLKDDSGNPMLCKVDKMTCEASGTIGITFRKNFDARKATEKGVQFKKSPNPLKDLFISKVTITPLGEIRRAND